MNVVLSATKLIFFEHSREVPGLLRGLEQYSLVARKAQKGGEELRIKKDSSAFRSRRRKDVVLESNDKCPVFNVELKEGESIQLLVPMSDGRTCVHLEVINGMLQIAGGASIIYSISGLGMKEKVEEDAEEDPVFQTPITEMGELGELGSSLEQDCIIDAGDLAGCTFDYLEAKYGLNFATRAAEWLKTLGLSMRQ